MFLRADKFDKAAKTAGGEGMVRMATTGEWRHAAHQSRGKTILSLLSAALDSSERRLFLLDEPEAALSPQRQLNVLCLLDDIDRDGRSQVVLATPSTILMAHPNADILWIGEDDCARTTLLPLGITSFMLMAPQIFVVDYQARLRFWQRHDEMMPALFAVHEGIQVFMFLPHPRFFDRRLGMVGQLAGMIAAARSGKNTLVPLKVFGRDEIAGDFAMVDDLDRLLENATLIQAEFSGEFSSGDSD